MSKSWGTRGTSTTVDMPGTSGMFWRREQRRHKLDPAQAEQQRRRFFMQMAQLTGLAVIVVQALVELARLHVHFGDQVCRLDGHPHIVLGVLVLGQVVALRCLRHQRAVVCLIATVLVAFVAWKLFGAWAMPSVHCA
jgi:hypothetical protein